MIATPMCPGYLFLQQYYKGSDEDSMDRDPCISYFLLEIFEILSIAANRKLG